MEVIKYENLIEIGPVVIEIQGVENGKLAVPINNTLVRHTAFLAANTRSCVLIYIQYSEQQSYYYPALYICVYLSLLFSHTK